MSEFKLKISIGTANIELEGEGTLVQAIFKDLRDTGLGKLLPDSVVLQNSLVENSNEVSNLNDDNGDTKVEQVTKFQQETPELPNIRDVVIKSLPKTEAEWILIYALYASNSGNSVFSNEDIKHVYQETGRWNDNRGKNFSANIKKAVVLGWFTTVNEDAYTLSDVGKQEASGILNRTADPESKKSKRKGQSFTKATYQVVDIAWTQSDREAIKKYINSFAKLTYIELSLAVAWWMKNHNFAEEVDENLVYTVLKTIGHSTSFDIKGSLRNGKNSNHYFVSGDSKGMYKVHHIGEDHLKQLEAHREDNK